MRRLAATLVLICFCLSVSGCRQPERVRLKPTEEEPPGLASTIQSSDPKVAVQFVRGFHAIENGWRWTMGKFAITLKPPRGAAQNGARLRFQFVLPDPVFSRTGPVTLSARAGSTELPSQKYTQAGNQSYEQDVPAVALAGDTVTIEFALNKYLAAGQVEGRELGVIATSVGLEAK